MFNTNLHKNCLKVFFLCLSGLSRSENEAFYKNDGYMKVIYIFYTVYIKSIYFNHLAVFLLIPRKLQSVRRHLRTLWKTKEKSKFLLTWGCSPNS